MAGTVPTNGTLKLARAGASASGVAGDHDKIGRRASDLAADHFGDAIDQRGLRQTAVGECLVISDVDVARIGPRRRDLAKHREAAET
jgi:predicted amidohydrolase